MAGGATTRVARAYVLQLCLTLNLWLRVLERYKIEVILRRHFGKGFCGYRS